MAGSGSEAGIGCPGRDAFEKMGKSVLVRGILYMPFFNNQHAEIKEFKKHKTYRYF